MAFPESIHLNWVVWVATRILNADHQKTVFSTQTNTMLNSKYITWAYFVISVSCKLFSFHRIIRRLMKYLITKCITRYFFFYNVYHYVPAELGFSGIKQWQKKLEFRNMFPNDIVCATLEPTFYKVSVAHRGRICFLLLFTKKNTWDGGWHIPNWSFITKEVQMQQLEFYSQKRKTSFKFNYLWMKVHLEASWQGIEGLPAATK